MNPTRIAIHLTLIAAAFSAPARAQSSQTFVSRYGTDVNTCTSAAAPCYSIPGAVVKTAEGATVNVLDTNNGTGCASGTLFLNKWVTINGGGPKVAIACVNYPVAISVNTQLGATVTLRDLDLGAMGDNWNPSSTVVGIQFVHGSLRLENVRIDGFKVGIEVTGGGRMTVRDTTISNDTTQNLAGIAVQPAAGLAVVDIERTHIRNASTGIQATNGARVSMRNSDISLEAGGAGTIGIAVYDTGGSDTVRVDVDSSAIFFHNKGILASGPNARIRLTNTFMANNTLAVSSQNRGVIESSGNNRFVGSSIDGAITEVTTNK